MQEPSVRWPAFPWRLFVILVLVYAGTSLSEDQRKFTMINPTIEALAERGEVFLDDSPTVAFRALKIDVVHEALPGGERGRTYCTRQPGPALLGALVTWPMYRLSQQEWAQDTFVGLLRYSRNLELTSAIAAIPVSGVPTALQAVMVYSLVGFWSGSRRKGLLAAMAFALATPAFAYARFPYHSAGSCAAVLLAFYGLVRAKEGHALAWAFLGGLGLGLVLFFALLPAFMLPVIGLFAAWVLWRRPSLLVAYVGGMVAGLLALGAANWLTLGNPFVIPAMQTERMTPDRQPSFSIHRLDDKWFYYIWSLRSGLVGFTPLMLLGAAGLFMGRRLRPRETGALWLALLAHLLYLSLLQFYGASQYGPRHLLPAWSFLALGLAFYAPATYWERTLLALCVLWSLTVELLSVFQTSMYWWMAYDPAVFNHLRALLRGEAGEHLLLLPAVVFSVVLSPWLVPWKALGRGVSSVRGLPLDVSWRKRAAAYGIGVVLYCALVGCLAWRAWQHNRSDALHGPMVHEQRAREWQIGIVNESVTEFKQAKAAEIVEIQAVPWPGIPSMEGFTGRHRPRGKGLPETIRVSWEAKYAGYYQLRVGQLRAQHAAEVPVFLEGLEIGRLRLLTGSNGELALPLFVPRAGAQQLQLGPYDGESGYGIDWMALVPRPLPVEAVLVWTIGTLDGRFDDLDLRAFPAETVFTVRSPEQAKQARGFPAKHNQAGKGNAERIEVRFEADAGKYCLLIAQYRTLRAETYRVLLDGEPVGLVTTSRTSDTEHPVNLAIDTPGGHTVTLDAFPEGESYALDCLALYALP